jgi:hypothetical protein
MVAPKYIALITTVALIVAFGSPIRSVLQFVK